MSLNKTFYKALEGILGPDYVSDDPVVTLSYAFPFAKDGAYMPNFEAITLPKTTEEVQAIVKLCNQFKVQFKAASTGWLYSDPGGSNCIRLDLRRMNRILEINEESMYAVVEPYVVGGQLQAELMKRGLNCNLCGAGANCSALPIAAHVNLGHLSQSGSYGERNQLALEWVTGDGEIVKLGSLGMVNEWFCADGPGPSLRGLVRGDQTPLGGLGVYTKAAQKIFHWAGPHTFPMEGVSPKYTTPVPDNFLVRYFSFKTLEDLITVVLKISEAEIATELMVFNPTMMAANLATKNIEEEIAIYNEFKDTMQGPGFMILLSGTSKADFEYKKHVMEQVVSEHSGMSLKAVEDPANEGGFVWRYFREVGSIKETGRVQTQVCGCVGATDSFTLISDFIKKANVYKVKAIEEGKLYNDGGAPFMQPTEHGHLAHGETICRMSRTQKGEDVMKLHQGFFDLGHQLTIDDHLGLPQDIWSDHSHDHMGPHTCNYHKWLRKVKKTFDPNGASDSSNYITAEKD